MMNDYEGLDDNDVFTNLPEELLVLKELVQKHHETKETENAELLICGDFRFPQSHICVGIEGNFITMQSESFNPELIALDMANVMFDRPPLFNLLLDCRKLNIVQNENWKTDACDYLRSMGVRFTANW